MKCKKPINKGSFLPTVSRILDFSQECSIQRITRISMRLNARHCVFICQIKFLMSYISLSVCTVQVTQTDDSINNICPFHFKYHALPTLSSFERAIVRHREISWSQGTFKGLCVCVYMLFPVPLRILCLHFMEMSVITLSLPLRESVWCVYVSVCVCVDSLCWNSLKCLCVCLMCKCHWSTHFFHLITHACFLPVCVLRSSLWVNVSWGQRKRLVHYVCGAT